MPVATATRPGVIGLDRRDWGRQRLPEFTRVAIFDFVAVFFIDCQKWVKVVGCWVFGIVDSRHLHKLALESIGTGTTAARPLVFD
jgi:hypothetical protein